MRKIFSLFAAILFAASMMADSYIITFKDGGTDSDKTSSLTSTTVSDYVDAGAEYVSAIAPTGKVYFAKTGAGLKFGNSSGGGSVTLTLATPIKPTSIVISASQFGASEGSGLFQEETFDMTGGGGKYAFNDYTVTYDGETEVATISVGTAKRGYVNSITVNYASQGGEEPVVEPETKTIYLNGGGASLWNQAEPEFFVHSWGGAADGDVHMTLVEGDVYKADIPADNTDLLFLRLATGTTEIVWSGEAHWNQSANQTIPEGKDLFTMTSWDNGEWSVYSAQGGETPDPVEPQPVDSMTVYYVNKSAWENVDAFVWPAEGDAYKAWPGEAMTKEVEQINGFDVYSYTFPASYVNLIFNNGNSGEGNQTSNLVWEAANPYFYDGVWYAKADIPTSGDPIVPPTPVDSMTVYFVNNLAWEAVNAYVWPAEGDAYKAWPGEAMTKEAEQINGFDVYSYTFPASYVNLIFNNGNSGEGNQTSNLVWEAAKPYFYGGAWYAKADIPTGGEQEQEEFVGFDARTTNLGEQIEAGLAKNLVNVTFVETSAGKYSVNLVEGGVEGSFSFGGVVFAYTHLEAGKTAFKTYNAYIQPNGTDREVRIPLNAGEKANVILTEACEGVLVNGVSTDLVSGDNILTATEDGLVLKTASTKPKIQAILPVVVPVDSMTVYYVNETAWENVDAFVWPAEGDAYKAWPGEAMTKEAEQINGFDVYSYTFPASYVNIIFNNGNGGEGNQTADLVWEDANPYFYDGVWYAKADIPTGGDPIVPPTPFDSMTVYYVNETAWENVNAFVWPAEGDAYKAWPGEAMTKEVEQINGFDVYSYTFPASYVNIIFNNGNGGEGNQTADLVWDATKPYFFDGEWYASVEEVAPHCAQVTEGIWTVTETTPLDANSIYVHNNLMKMKPAYAAAWDGFNNPQQFGEYSFTYAMLIRSNVLPTEQIPAGAEYVGGSKNTTSLIVEAKEDIDITIFYRRQTGDQSENDSKDLKIFDHSAIATAIQGVFQIVEIDGDYFSATKKLSLVKGHRYTITAKGTTPKIFAIAYGQPAEPEPAKFYITGDAALVGEELAWHADAIKVTEDSYTFENLAAGDYKLKVTVNGAWEPATDVKGFSDLTTIADGLTADDGGAICFTLAEAGNVSVHYDGEYFFLNGNFYVAPVEIHYYLKNNWGTEDWTWKELVYNSDNNDYELTSVVGGPGVNFNTAASDEGAAWIAWDQINSFDQSFEPAAIGALDTVDFFFNPEYVDSYTGDNGISAMIIGKYVTPVDPQPEEHTYTVAGNNITLFGTSWDPTDTNNDMTLVEGIYKWEKSEVALAQGTVEFKVVKDHDWNDGANAYPADNYQLAIPADGIYTVTITFDPANLTVNASAEKTGDAEVEKHYLVVGQAMVANDEDWNNNADINLMTSADEGLTYTLTIADLQLIAGTSYRYKIVEKGSWVEYFPKHADNSDTCFTVPQDGIYTITYVYTVATSLCEVQAQRTGDLPAARLTDGYYLVGTFSGVPAWTVDDLTEDQRFVEVLTDEYGTSYSLAANLAVDDSIKVVKIVHDAIVLWMPEGTGNNVVIDANHAGEAKIIHLAVAVTGEWSYYVEPNIQDGFYLLGTMNNWTPSDEYRFGKDATCGENEFILNTTLAIDDQIKVAKVENGVATTWYPDGEDNNYVVDAAHEGVKAIYFQETYKEDWAAFGGYFWMGSNEPTAISNTAADAKAVKILNNGMLLIRKGNKTYNIMGQAVK